MSHGCGSALCASAIAFRRSTAALAKANASSFGSARDPRFLRPGLNGRYPFLSVPSLPRTAETGPSAGRSGTQSRPGSGLRDRARGTTLAPHIRSQRMRTCPIHRQAPKNDLIDPLQRPAPAGCIVNLRLGYLSSMGHACWRQCQLPTTITGGSFNESQSRRGRYWDSSSSSRIESRFPRKMPKRAPAGLKLLSRPH
jgi:hypothetical protein